MKKTILSFALLLMCSLTFAQAKIDLPVAHLTTVDYMGYTYLKLSVVTAGRDAKDIASIEMDITPTSVVQTKIPTFNLAVKKDQFTGNVATVDVSVNQTAISHVHSFITVTMADGSKVRYQVQYFFGSGTRATAGTTGTKPELL